MLRTGAASSGIIESPYLGTLALTGGFDGMIRAVAPGGEPLGRGGYSIGQIRVTGGDLLGTLTADAIRSLSVRDGDIGAVIDVDGALNMLTVSGSAGGNMLAGSSLTVGGNLNSARVSGELTGVWDIGGNIRAIRHGGTADDWTLQTPAATQVIIGSLQLGDVANLTMTGLANIRTLRSGAIAAGSIEANSIRSLVGQGDLLADLTLTGEDLGAARVLSLARIAGNVTDATWTLTGEVGIVRIAGDQTGFNIIAA